MRALLVSLCLFVASSAFADPIKFDLSQNGTHIGDNTYDLKADGSFSSVTKIDVMGVKIDSSIIGKFTKGTLSEFTLDQNRSGVKVHLKFAGGKTIATVNGATQPPIEIQPTKFLYSDLNPGIASTLFANLDLSGPEPKQIKLSMLDNAGMPIDATVVATSPRTIQRGGKDVTIRILKLLLSSVEIEYACNPEGQIVAEQVPAQKLKMVAEGYDAVFVDPVLKYKELSQPTFKVKFQRGVKVAMRDGTVLVQDIAMPDAPGKFPTILSRTPYGRGGAMVGSEWWAQRGYVFIGQDCRGRHDSGGTWDPFVAERKDGKDSIDWIAKQSWSDAKVGMIGGSYGGYVQWAAAVEHPAALKCIIPQVSPPDAMLNIPYDNGVFMLLPNLWWANLVRDKVSHMERATQPLPHGDKLLTLPLSKIDDAVLGVDVPFFDSWLKRDGMAAWKGGFDFQADLHTVTIPALHISGWWDGDGIGTKTNWAAMRAAGRTNQWLIDGPWPHGFNASTKFGDVDYGPTSVIEIDSIYLRWFDTWLKGKSVGFDKVPKVQAFLTGANKWLELSDWPEKAAATKSFFLGEAGKLLDAPQAGKPSTYTYDPSKALVPEEVKGNMMAQGSTIANIDFKDDSGLAFKTDPFAADQAFGGPLTVDLYFSTNVVSTNFFAMLCDVDEKGVARLVSLPGKINVSYLHGLDKPRPITPGQVYHATFDLWDTAHQFKKGHRLAIAVFSSMFPSYARNLNTGEPVFSAKTMKVAKQTIYGDPQHPSSIKMTVLKTD